ALVGDPDLVFRDEPTTGFDPQARRAAWEMIRSLRSLGKTVLLTTHYLDEAEQLADRVAVLREGRIVRVGTPAELTTTDLQTEIRYRQGGEEVLVRTDEPTRVLAELTSAALARGEELEGLQVRRPSREHRLRRARDPARDPARERDPQAASLDAAAAGYVRRFGARLDADRLRIADRGAVPARPRAQRDAFPLRRRVAGRRGRDRRSRVRRPRHRNRFGHPLGGGLLGGRQRHPAADGLPERLVRVDAPLSRIPPRDRRCPATQVLHQP